MVKHQPTVLGANLLRIRKSKGLSQHALAQLSGVASSHISLLETGKYRDIYLSRGVALAHALGVTVEELVKERVRQLPPAKAGGL